MEVGVGEHSLDETWTVLPVGFEPASVHLRDLSASGGSGLWAAPGWLCSPTNACVSSSIMRSAQIRDWLTPISVGIDEPVDGE
jgi:hypothetical protein